MSWIFQKIKMLYNHDMIRILKFILGLNRGIIDDSNNSELICFDHIYWFGWAHTTILSFIKSESTGAMEIAMVPR
ncbi:hypothetical protein BK131_08915 [Paenibacillus amylolyticus]|uniref:Uncharacterized protein n=1 Tax=Paenibacillus amylolyticus TaxID=1451 RepID=A0A1R1BZ33_PAEAM|nr:hypothetical protein BK131_08915 [Paenibacillus amylolyticus]